MSESLYKKEMIGWYDKLYCKSEKTKEQIKFLTRIFKKNKCKKILDVSCGTGRHSIELAKKGFSVTGLDIEKGMIKYAKEKSSSAKNVKFIIGDMRNFNLRKEFDAAIIMYGSFAYMTTNKDAIACLSSIKKHMKKNGILIVEDDNPWQDIAAGKSTTKYTAKSGKAMLGVEHKIKNIYENNLMQITSRYQRQDDQKKLPLIKDKKHVILRIFSKNEMELLLMHAGFKKIEFFGDFKGKKFTKKNYKKLITVAKKA